MQLDPLKTPRSVDAKTAEEALSLALRLQQERGERISIDELQKTADEAGIDREYLESALQQVTTRHIQPPEIEKIPRRFEPRMIVMMAAGIAVGFSVMTLFLAEGNIHPLRIVLLPFFLAMIAARLLARRACKEKRSFKDRDS